ncbi:TPA: hypothetical protein P7P18_001870 [Escherichia coli]|uniref:hypothetical protein n=1 Tax=Escherichia coli TaxID=562 RepID=UPI00092CB5D6|nr:hypothetical protein [Escherichia coli]OJL62297.1 hypothetical protein BK265_14480 [Escherichia coli]HDP9059249.1 hypothetical protein [Escherichia coli]HDP9068682.1 hypothetical protein [Escherichia coli]HDP9464484.1 hypothetical protein [Escherichia coli]HDQ1166709.1 hypothetical protein [Escherichia coli]
MHLHKLVTPGLASLPGDLSYLDIDFVFSGNEARKARYRLVFCPPSLDPVAAETMHNMLGADVYGLCVSVVSFVDMIQLDRQQEQLQNAPLGAEEPINVFAKPEGSFNLTLGELQYLYGTLVDLMLKVADNEGIQILFFAAEREELMATYKRYVKRFTQERGLTYLNDGASYAIRTQHYPKQRED